jgi:hypothetical protein
MTTRPAIDRIRLLTRIALFAALCYVTSLATLALPNVKLLFFVVFSAGFLWGIGPGILVGLFGIGLWTFFNPFGPAGLPMSIVQMIGGAVCGIVGALFFYLPWEKMSRLMLSVSLILASLVVTLLFFVPVNLLDAWLFGPFWPRFWMGMSWSVFSIAANALIFPLLFRAVRLLYERECSHG